MILVELEPIRRPSLAYAAGWDVQGFRIGSIAAMR